ncbi:hypothetical protein EVA_11486 [gut metagenome]|uniref:Uncharacterized protein n=1 Tax=gut metagenome TaxID=749906 RepID=J9GL11_9ZZZZ
MTFITKLQDFALQHFRIDRIETRKGFVEDEQRRLVKYGDDKLHLLLHTLGEFFEFLVPPGHDTKLRKPTD